MLCPPLSLVIFFALKSTFSDNNTATPLLFWLLFTKCQQSWYIFFILLLSTCISIEFLIEQPITAKWWWKSRIPQGSPLTQCSLLLIKGGFPLSVLWHDPGKGRNLGSLLGIFWRKWGWDHSCFVAFHWSRMVFI